MAPILPSGGETGDKPRPHSQQYNPKTRKGPLNEEELSQCFLLSSNPKITNACGTMIEVLFEQLAEMEKLVGVIDENPHVAR